MDYQESQPIQARIRKINHLYDLGNTIVLLTARGSESGVDWSAVTSAQLASWGLKYHKLVFGKPAADFYVDDKGISSHDFDWE